MQPPIFATVAADATATALLGTSPTRLFPMGMAPQNVATPYAVWQVITGSPENYLACRPDMDGYTLQIDAYAKTVSEASAAADAIRAAIEPHAYVVRLGMQLRDDDTQHYRISFDVDWLVHR